MAMRFACPDGIRIVAEPLTRQAFAPFGDAIYNPQPHLHPSQAQTGAASSPSLPPNASSANQGSAIKYSHVSRPRNLYGQAPSGRGEPIMSIFSCASVTPTPASAPTSLRTVPVRYLERHPFTSQTFTPIKSSASAYLVIVAPTLPAGRGETAALPAPEGAGLPGRGMPDVNRLRAFVATGEQAVTYAAGTWHAPMMVLGGAGEVLDFLVSQFASGVAAEDCQLVECVGQESSSAAHPLVVSIPGSLQGEKRQREKL